MRIAGLLVALLRVRLDRSEAKSEVPRPARPSSRDFAPNRSEAKSEVPQSAWPFPRDFAPDRSEAKSEAA